MNRPSSVGNFYLVYRALSLLLRSLNVDFFLLDILWLQLKVQTLQASSVHVSIQSAEIITVCHIILLLKRVELPFTNSHRGHIVNTESGEGREKNITAIETKRKCPLEFRWEVSLSR